METNKNNQFFNIILGIIGLSPFIYWISTRINQDSWWDELISLRSFALVDLGTTISDYPEPNNHILFNLINNIYTRILGVRDFYENLDYMYNLRILQAFFALVTIYYSFLIIRKFFSKSYAFIVVAILSSTIPFLNFSLQLRGYNISMMFSVMLIFYVWNYFQEKRKLDLFLITGIVFSLLYTIPSNIYFLFAVAVTVLFSWKRERAEFKKQIEPKSKKKKKDKLPSVFEKIDKAYFLLIVAVLSGLILTYFAYLPVMENLLDNRFVSKAPAERFYVTTNLLPIILTSFLSARWLILLILGAIVFFSPLFNSKMKNNTIIGKYKIRSLVAILILPFLFITMHNKLPFQRTFIVLAPIFALIISVWIIQLIEYSNLKTNYKYLILSALSIYFVITSYVELENNDKQLSLNLQSEIREQNIYRNFYLTKDFTPHALAKKIAKMENPKTPVLMLDELDRVSLTYYLEKYDIQSQAVIRIQDKPVNLKGQNYNQVGLIQKSVGKNIDLNFMQIPCNLTLNPKLNPYLLLLSLNSQPASGKSILISAFPNRVEEFKSKIDQYQFNEIDQGSFVQLYEVSKKF